MTGVDRIADLYRSAFESHGRSSAAVLCPKGRHDERFSALLAHLNPEGRHILDFGCGLGHLLGFLRQRDIRCHYTGVDIVPEFIASNREAYRSELAPGDSFELIQSIDDIAGRFDIVIASGVFNLKYQTDDGSNAEFVRQSIAKLFDKSTEALSIDFMTTHVDFVQAGAYHVDPAEIVDFAIRNLSRRVALNHSYLPFEFCVTAFKQNAIDKASGRYA